MEFHVIFEHGSVGIDDLSIERGFTRRIEHVPSVVSVCFRIQVFLLLDNFELLHIVFEVHGLDQPILSLLQVSGDEASVLSDSVSVPVVSLVIRTSLVELAGGVQRGLLGRAKTVVC